MAWEKDDIELAFIREFSSGGVQLGGSMSSDTRRDRIRVEIYRHQRGDQQLQDSGLTYSQAYRKAYGRPIEMRLVPREDRVHPSIMESLGLDSIDDLKADDHYCACGKIHSREELQDDLCDNCGKKTQGALQL